MPKVSEIIHWNAVKIDGFPQEGEDVLAWAKTPDGGMWIEAYRGAGHWFRIGTSGPLCETNFRITHWARVNGPRATRVMAVQA